MDNRIDRFDDIRPVDDTEVHRVITELLEDQGFRNAVKYVNPNMPWETFSAIMATFHTKSQFQGGIIAPIVWGLAEKTSTNITHSGWENINGNEAHTCISNHRDIILDAGLLNIVRHQRGLDTTEIAIGDNLFVYPWIEKLVRLNKSFVVRRGISVRQMLEASKHLSDYIHHTITQKKESVWIAQREGRAKDSSDRTQESVLKMLALMPPDASHLEALRELNIVPLTVSYEFDPCDYLKAAEFQLKRDNADYKKTQADDLKNMETGLMGFKGRIHFRLGKPLNGVIDSVCKGADKQQIFTRIATAIDAEIHRNYELYPINYVAYDLLHPDNSFAHRYTAEEKAHATDYIENQLAKINIPNKDDNFLRNKMLEMYSNILKNYITANQ